MKNSRFFYKLSVIAVWGVVLTAFFSSYQAFAATDVDNIAQNIVNSGQDLPGLITALSYLLALLFGVSGILKVKDHVENPNQTPIRTPIIRFLAGGALLALPVVYAAMKTTIDGGNNVVFNDQGNQQQDMAEMAGNIVATSLVPSFNTVLKSIKNSTDELPGIITAGAYLFGLVMGAIGILKIKEHVENPEQTPVREGIVRLLTGGAMFALPTIFKAAFMAINSSGLYTGPSSGSIMAMAGSINIGAILMLGGGYDLTRLNCTPAGNTFGDAVCAAIANGAGFPMFLTFLGYLIGMGLVIWGVLKLKSHVINPAQTQLSEGLTRIIAGGCFFALPAVVAVGIATIREPTLLTAAMAPVTTYHELTATCNGLDGVVYCFMKDMLMPLNVAINFFAFCAGTVLIMVGISRLIKSTQEGPRGPLGMGTFLTFLAGGALCSYNELMRAATGSFFIVPTTETYALLMYTSGMTAAEVDHAHTVISAILKFMIVVGLISFVRGIFIIRESAEGGQQASVMAGVTHMIGGALAVNLGPLINAVEATLGLGAFGIKFT